jgi:hypothetical protein
MQAGDTFRFTDRKLEEHLWVVMSDPMLDVADPVVVVRLTTYRRGRESACILQPGDHESIQHKTAVDYEWALDISNAGLEGFVGSGRAIRREPVSPGYSPGSGAPLLIQT